MTSSRALLALTHPSPGYLGSSYNDVQTIFGEEAATTTENQTTLVSAARKSSQWKSRIVSFWTEASDDTAATPAFRKHLGFWSKATDFSKDDVAKVLADVNTWSQSLRKGACDGLIEVLCKVSKKAWADVAGEISADHAVRYLVDELSKFTKDPALRSIRVGLRASSAQQARDSALAAAVQAIDGWTYGLEDLADIMEKFEVVEDLPKQDAMVAMLSNFRGFLAKALAAKFSSIASRSADFDRCTVFANLCIGAHTTQGPSIEIWTGRAEIRLVSKSERLPVGALHPF
jgi:hypothetical protein